MRYYGATKMVESGQSENDIMILYERGATHSFWEKAIFYGSMVVLFGFVLFLLFVMMHVESSLTQQEKAKIMRSSKY